MSNLARFDAIMDALPIFGRGALVGFAGGVLLAGAALCGWLAWEERHRDN